jgi:hypothetical protein
MFVPFFIAAWIMVTGFMFTYKDNGKGFLDTDKSNVQITH